MRAWIALACGVLSAAACTAAPKELTPAARAAIADSVRAESMRMVEVMKTRKVDDVLAFYGKRTAYAGEGTVGDWAAIVKSAPARYAAYTKVECGWDGLTIDVLAPNVAVVTGALVCDKADTSGRSWHEVAVRTEVVAWEEGRWRIVAVHESSPPGAPLEGKGKS